MSAATVERVSSVESAFIDSATLTRRPAPPPRIRAVPALPPGEVLLAPPPAPVPTVQQRIVALRASDRSTVIDAADEGRGPVPAAEPGRLASTIAQAGVEVLMGRRSVGQLARWLTPGVYDALHDRATLTLRAVGPRSARRAPTVRRARVWRVDEHALEASVVVDDGLRVRAVALRLESHRGSWRATALEIG